MVKISQNLQNKHARLWVVTKVVIFLLVVGSLSLAAFGAETETVCLKDVKGGKVAPLEGKGQRATVLFFITNDCPIANTYAPEIERIYRAYAPKKFALYLVYVDPDLSATQARQHWREYGYHCPALLDPKHLLVKKTGATVTPEVAVLAPNGKLLYRGRIDDRCVDFGKMRLQPTQRDLRRTLDAILKRQPIPLPFTKAIGCFIPPAETTNGKEK